MKAQVIYTSIKQTDVDPYGKVSKKIARIRVAVTHSGFGLHDGLETRLKERDKKRAGLYDDNEDSEDDEDHDEAYVSSISKKSITTMRTAGTTRILRSGTNRRFPPTEMIAASNIEDGTYQYFDLDQRVSLILNNFETPHKKKTKYLFEYTDTCEIQHLRGYISYSATIRWNRTMVYRPSRIGKNTFWETGYVGESESIPYYSSKENAWRAVSLRILVDYFSYKIENKANSLSSNDYWPTAVMNKTTRGDNFVVLAEPKGGDKQNDHLFCIVIKHGNSCVMLIPRREDYHPWKEVEFKAGNWSKKRPASKNS